MISPPPIPSLFPYTTLFRSRSKLGATQNRLEHTINNLGASQENVTAAESRIRDVDMAKEMMEFTKNNILTQASQSDRKSTRLNSSHVAISYAVFCLKKKNTK